MGTALSPGDDEASLRQKLLKDLVQRIWGLNSHWKGDGGRALRHIRPDAEAWSPESRKLQEASTGVPGTPVIKTPPASAGNTGSIPTPVGSRIPRGS